MTPTSSYTSSGTGRRSQEYTPAAALRGFLEHSARRAAELSPGYEHVWARIGEVAAAGDGLQRDLVMAVVESYPARPTRPVLNAVAASFELLSTALLLRGEGVSPGTTISPLRRVPAPAAAPAEPAPGDSVHRTSLASQLALAGAYRMVATSHAPESRLLKLLDILDHSVFHATAGERLTGELTRRPASVSHREVLEALRIGGAVPCWESPLRAGAVLGGAPTAHVNALADTGRALGVGHGLAEELRLAADPHGAGPRELLRADRPTVLGTFVASGPHGPAWRTLCERAARSALTEDDAARARELLDRSGSVRAVERMVHTARQRAEHAMVGGKLPTALVERLTAWADRELNPAEA
ncbi:hypothetical protein [Kocuria sp.]|uniref:hypothetical protein n=1 Tax=Kocuria sp. TaxID=1871328 RepID=UPI0026DCA6D6|nr:hypothetical protein [Kocuria sp.]MDO4918928.1 hypothetical protein [Kocuria sp.]